MEQKKNYTQQGHHNQQKPQMNGQRVTFENGKLVILANRGRLDASGNAEVPMEGLFTINAQDLAKVCSMLTDMRYLEEEVFVGGECKLLRLFNPKDDVVKLSCEIELLNDKVEKLYKKNEVERRKYNNLLLAIREFNETRKLWERKFEVYGETDDNAN